MSEEEELTLFDIKYNEAMERLDSLFSLEKETNSSSIKYYYYIERYNLDKSIEKKNLNKNRNVKSQSNLKINKKLVLKEIDIKEKLTKQYYNQNSLKNEIEWYKVKKRQKEMRNKFNNIYIRKKLENDISKENIKINKIKIKKYSNFANKIDNIKLKSKKSEQNIYDLLNNELTMNTNNYNSIINDSKFLSYDKNKSNKIVDKNNYKNKLDSIYRLNFNQNKKIILKKKINNINNLSQQINMNRNNNMKYLNKEYNTFNKKPFEKKGKYSRKEDEEINMSNYKNSFKNRDKSNESFNFNS